MEDEVNLPFKVGQQIEAKSFEEGYRGAWFKCMIKEISKREGILGHVLEYIDYPDEELEWTVMYQETCDDEEGSKEKHRELMLRPQYPHIYNQKKMPHVSKITEVTVIAGHSWRVGNLVDWWTTGCYWSGRITQLIGCKKAQIELKAPPLGEGLSYEVLLKDLRPSLDWSPELGWTVPTQEVDTGRPSVQLVKPVDQGLGAEAVEVSAGSFLSSPPSSIPAVSDEEKSTATETRIHPPGKRVSKRREDDQEGSTSHVGKNKAAAGYGEDLSNPDYCRVLKSKRSDTLEAAIVVLEEYVNKVKWLKRVLQHGISSSDEQGPQWKFVGPLTAMESPK